MPFLFFEYSAYLLISRQFQIRISIVISSIYFIQLFQTSLIMFQTQFIELELLFSIVQILFSKEQQIPGLHLSLL